MYTIKSDLFENLQGNPAVVRVRIPICSDVVSYNKLDEISMYLDADKDIKVPAKDIIFQVLEGQILTKRFVEAMNVLIMFQNVHIAEANCRIAMEQNPHRIYFMRITIML